MKKTLLKSAALAISSICLLATTSIAAPITINNGGFETGDLTGWIAGTGDGSATVVTQSTAYDGDTYLPTGGNYHLQLIATQDVVQTSLSWNAGDTIFFDWAFLSYDYMPYNDYVFFSAYDTLNNPVTSVTLASVFDTGDYEDTGWNKYTYTFNTNGGGYIKFGSQNVNDNILDSILLVDNVNVPEPATMLLLGTGLAGIATLRRKKTKATS